MLDKKCIEMTVELALEGLGIKGLVYVCNNSVYVYALDTQIEEIKTKFRTGRESWQYVYDEIFKYIPCNLCLTFETIPTPKDIKINIEMRVDNEKKN